MSSYMQGFERDTCTAVITSKRVGLVHLVLNALLMIAFFYWLRIPEETGWQFTLTVVSGLFIAFVTLWLHTATFDYFRPAGDRGFRDSLRRSLIRIPAFLVWSVVFGLGLWLIGQFWSFDEQMGGWVRHLLPLFLRRQVTPRTMFSLWHWVVWFLYFFLWPVLLLPIGAQVATKNLRGLISKAAFRPIRKVRFWITYLVCFVIGAYVPYTLAWMTPTKRSSLNAQTWSMVVRLGIGYLLLVTAWVVLCAAIMRVVDGKETPAKEPEPTSEPVL